MKTNRLIWVAVSAALFATAAQAEEVVTNRLTLSARLGFNLSARFRGSATSLTPPARTTPHGDSYNYDDGYVLTDISGNAGGQTWYVGYDNSASQVSGNNILMSRSTPGGSFSSPSFGDDPIPGLELTYNGRLGALNGMNYGVEAAGNFMNISLHNRSTFSGSVSRVTDAYPFTPGTTPPGATPGNPYQGSYEGPGFLLGDTPVSSSTALVPGGITVSGSRKIDADLWGFRLGPYLDFPLADNVNIWVSGGLAAGLITADASWSDIITVPGSGGVNSSGSGHNDALVWGYFLAANASWDLSDHWSAVLSVQYQDLGNYRHNFGGRTVELDLSNSFFLTIGFSRKF